MQFKKWLGVLVLSMLASWLPVYCLHSNTHHSSFGSSCFSHSWDVLILPASSAPGGSHCEGSPLQHRVCCLKHSSFSMYHYFFHSYTCRFEYYYNTVHKDMQYIVPCPENCLKFPNFLSMAGMWYTIQCLQLCMYKNIVLACIHMHVQIQYMYIAVYKMKHTGANILPLVSLHLLAQRKSFTHCLA